MTEQNNDGMKRYKFMTNILHEGKDRTTYVKMLEKVTPAPYVSYTRLLVGVTLMVFFTLGLIVSLLNSGTAFKYTFLGKLSIWAGLMILTILFFVPARQISMLSAVTAMVKGVIYERIRLRMGINDTLRSLGIRKVDEDGILYFNPEPGEVDEEYGILCLVEGQLSASMLPAVAQDAAAARSQYNVTRADSTHELLITQIRNVTAKENIESLHENRKQYVGAQDKKSRWKRYMSTFQEKYIESAIKDKEFKIVQHLIIREKSQDALMKAKNTLLLSSRHGLYSRIRFIYDQAEITEALAPLTMLSSDNARRFKDGKKAVRF